MAVNLISYDYTEDDYIDVELDSFYNFHGHSISSPPFHREFEFHMSSLSLDREQTTSPADELFYKGKLLPLHLPPRLQMVEELLQNHSPSYATRKDDFEETYSTPLATPAATPTSTSTPFESWNISPSESCRISRELNPEEYLSHYTTDVRVLINESVKKSWRKKFMLVKQSSLCSKLKASQAYLKSLFVKSSCSDESCVAANVADEISASKAKESSNKYAKATKKNPFGQIQRERHQVYSARDRGKIIENSVGHHRRSLSMAIRRHSTNMSPYSSSSSSSSGSSSSSSGSSSSSSSNNTNRIHIRPYLKRSTSMNSEIENLIQGAIAHCKQSQQSFHPKQISNEIGVYSLSASRLQYMKTKKGLTLAGDEKEREGVREGCGGAAGLDWGKDKQGKTTNFRF